MPHSSPFLLGPLAFLLGLLSGCDVSNSNTPAVLRLASTTSTRDSGLLDVLLPEFEKAHGCRVDLVAVGTGAALKLGEAGDVDVVLCHAPAAEESFMQAGHGVRREPLMHNFFVLVGPADDPAGIRDLSAAEALQKIAAGQHRFLSRGDDSGTHQRELALWKKSDIQPMWSEYWETGQGMGPTLTIADEKNAYTLVDEGTWLKQGGKLRLEVLAAKSQALENSYAAIAVNPAKNRAIRAALANEFLDFLIAAAAQQRIAEYQINGKPLFHPDRLPQELQR